ncbi:MAG TPA: hypothetical protein VIU12_31345, partial [Chryseolinea sp.]
LRAGTMHPLKAGPVAEPTIICPTRKNEIKLTESLAAPFSAGKTLREIEALEDSKTTGRLGD